MPHGSRHFCWAPGNPQKGTCINFPCTSKPIWFHQKLLHSRSTYSGQSQIHSVVCLLLAGPLGPPGPSPSAQHQQPWGCCSHHVHLPPRGEGRVLAGPRASPRGRLSAVPEHPSLAARRGLRASCSGPALSPAAASVQPAPAPLPPPASLQSKPAFLLGSALRTVVAPLPGTPLPLPRPTLSHRRHPRVRFLHVPGFPPLMQWRSVPEGSEFCLDLVTATKNGAIHVPSKRMSRRE